MIQIHRIPESVLNSTAAIFNTYNYILYNRHKKSKKIRVMYETLAGQMKIDISHVRNYTRELALLGAIDISEPNIKKNGLKGAITFTLTDKDKKYAIVPQNIMMDESIPKSFRQYYARLKRIININNFTTFKNPAVLQKELGCKERTYWEFMNLMKNTKITGKALILDESYSSQYKFIMEYDQYVEQDHKKGKAMDDTLDTIKNQKVMSNENATNIL